MAQENKTKEALMEEVGLLRKRIAELEASLIDRELLDKLLRENEERFRLLYEQAPIPYQSLDKEGLFLEVNQVWLDALGYARDEVIGRWFGDFLTPKYAELFKTRFLCFQADKEVHGIEFDMVRKDGQSIHVSFEGKIGFDAQGFFQRTHCVFTDITERKKIEFDLKASEERFRKAFATISDAVMILEIDSGRIVECNDRLFGYTREELLGRFSVELALWAEPNDRQAFVEEFKTRGFVRDLEAVVRRKDGSTFDALISADQITLGGVVLMLSVARDITERKKATIEAMRLKTAIEQVPIGVALADENLNLYFCNAAGLGMRGGETKLVGIPKEMFKNWQVLKLDGTPYEVAALPLVRAFREKTEIREEFIIRHQDGSEHICDASAVPVNDDKGYVMGSVVIFPDITDRKRNEALLRESEARAVRAVADSPIPIMIHDEDDRVIQLSSGWTKFSGYTIEDIPTLGDWTEKAYGERTGLKKDYIDQLFTIDRTVSNGEWTVTAKDGSKRIWDFQTTPIGRTREGRRVLHSMAIDITENMKAAKALRESEEKFRLIAQLSPAGIYLTTPKGECLYTNERWREMAGLSLEESLGVGWMRGIHPEDRQMVMDSWQRMVDSQGHWGKEYRFQNKDGKITEVYGLATPQTDAAGKIVGYIGLNMDITERKEAEEVLRHAKEQAEEANKAKSEFLNNIAHDFRTPMQAIMGFSDYFKSEQMTVKQKRYAEIINEKSKGLLSLVEELLDVSRLDAGRLELRSIEFDLSKSVQQAVEMARGDLVGKDIKLDCSIDGNIPPLKGDAVRFSQVLTNLLTNAVKYTDHGEIAVKVVRDLENCPDGKCRLRVSVKDTGLGIPVDQQERIFEAYTRFQEFNGGRERGGVGLGLYITKTLIELMGGTISVVSEVGVGSEFIVSLDIDKA